MNKYQAEIESNLAFRSIVAKYNLTAIDATNILNGMLVEWQREAHYQILIDMQQEQNATKPNNVENEE